MCAHQTCLFLLPTSYDTCYAQKPDRELGKCSKKFLKAKHDNLHSKLINIKGANSSPSFQFSAGRLSHLTFVQRRNNWKITPKMFIFEITLKCILWGKQSVSALAGASPLWMGTVNTLPSATSQSVTFEINLVRKNNDRVSKEALY